MKLTNHLHLMSRFRMSGTISALLICLHGVDRVNCNVFIYHGYSYAKQRFRGLLVKIIIKQKIM
jgi:hypothetical protein